ncbi:MAG: hypothetical protein WDZ49_06150 [Litorilinea sp.]
MNRKIRALVVGVAFGALVGGIFGYLSTNAENDEGDTGLAALGPADYFQLGIGILTLARQFGSMVKKI